MAILLPRQGIPGEPAYQHSLAITVPVHNNVAAFQSTRYADDIGFDHMIWYGPAGHIVRRIGNSRNLNRVIPPPKPSPPTALSRRAEADPATPNPVWVTPRIGGPHTDLHHQLPAADQWRRLPIPVLRTRRATLPRQRPRREEAAESAAARMTSAARSGASPSRPRAASVPRSRPGAPAPSTSASRPSLPGRSGTVLPTVRQPPRSSSSAETTRTSSTTTSPAIPKSSSLASPAEAPHGSYSAEQSRVNGSVRKPCVLRLPSPVGGGAVAAEAGTTR